VVGNPSVEDPTAESDLRTRVRRKDREISEQEKIRALLERAQVGFIATSIDDQPYLNPNLFWYDASTQRIYFHTAITGRTRSNIEANQNVCFCIAEMGELLPAEAALEFSTEYASVIVFGKGVLLHIEDEQRDALQGLLDKYFPTLTPGEDYRVITADELSKTSVFAIDIESWSGKEKRVEP
jgi:nitroimidazol reductase NimA-like FMN-containing flavoprotein (pyridoxamine 5'-phosphate oxidase superfamily)